ncbi:MAG: DUF4189 domain-containing protein [Betaproteobacteria bacterium]|nr:DUF4189 domain-containing protein [Betaproteobacteria bacterium]
MKLPACTLALALTLLSPTAFSAGAIAVDDEVGDKEPGYGLVYGYGSRDEAAVAALAECKKSNEHCKVVARFDKCGAYAASLKYYGVGWGVSAAEAQTMAMDNCGHSNCRIVVVDCE